jgi:Ni/Fe-hydrogenase subunit HybB-like protein
MKILIQVFSAIHAVMAALFAGAALLLVAIATHEGWRAAMGGFDQGAAQQIIEAVGLLAAAVVALQISQTIAEEEVIRDAHISAPTRVRRFLSRFFVVVVVALVIEGLVATFKAIHEDMAQLVYAAALLLASAALLAGWGVFIRLNRFAEELEPEAMAEAKREDKKLAPK